jgi:type IV secretory pathway VirJ component
MIDWSLALAATAARPEPCHYLIGDLERLIQRYQTVQSYPRYVPPVVIGLGEGGDVAYALLAQAPPLAIAGAVGIGRTGKLKSNAPFCNEAGDSALDAQTRVYGAKPDTSGWWRSVVTRAETEEAAFARASSGGGANQANTVIVAA